MKWVRGSKPKILLPPPVRVQDSQAAFGDSVSPLSESRADAMAAGAGTHTGALSARV